MLDTLLRNIRRKNCGWEQYSLPLFSAERAGIRLNFAAALTRLAVDNLENMLGSSRTLIRAEFAMRWDFDRSK